MPEPISDEDVLLANYRKLVAAGRQGSEAVRMVMQEIAPDKTDWVRAADELIQAQKDSVPVFVYEDPEFGGTVCFPPAERPLRRILNEDAEKSDMPSPM